jgi:hypothetical protein
MRLICALLLVLLAAPGFVAATTLEQYAARLTTAAARMGVLFGEGRDKPSDSEIVSILDEVRGGLPAKVEVSVGEGIVAADNSALIKALEQLSFRYQKKLGSDEDRRDELVDLTSQLNLLSNRVEAAAREHTVGARIEKEKLLSILARDEFKPELREESRLYKWSRKLWNDFIRLLEQLLTSQDGARPKPGRASLDVVRLLIAVGLAIALVAGTRFLVRRLRRRRSKHKGDEAEQEVREILGEEIAADATAEELLARAAELARQGDYRAAIRRAFIALLFELEQRGKVRLDPSKTNHDYLNEVRTDSELLERVSSLTSVFERVWYGQKRASSEDYVEFIDRWRGTVGISG